MFVSIFNLTKEDIKLKTSPILVKRGHSVELEKVSKQTMQEIKKLYSKSKVCYTLKSIQELTDVAKVMFKDGHDLTSEEVEVMRLYSKKRYKKV